MSVSRPFLTASVQLGATHRPLVHTRLLQSPPVPQPKPGSQRAQLAKPPQSTPLSPPFCTPSLQEGTAHLKLVLHLPSAQSPFTAQLWPSAQSLFRVLQGAVLPQSVSDSLAFFTPSVQVAAWHTCPVQTPVVHSLARLQPWPALQAGHDPPQSVSVSFPSLRLSLQVAAVQTNPTHRLLMQSPLPTQELPVMHGEHELPPQSVSVSLPSLRPSLQLAVTHTLFVHTPVRQSPATLQARPVAHLLVLLQEPPQSVSVSVPFLTVSLQLGTLHTSGLPAHTPLVQSLASAQDLPSMHAAHEPPPQLTSVSLPFFTVSVHDGL
jgi:hypothetical protein